MQHPKDKPHQQLPNLYLGIVDFDSAIYRCAAVHNDDEEGLVDAKVTLFEFVQNNIVNPTGCEKYLFLVTGPDNFRHDVATTKPYKGQRPTEKPIHYLELLDWAIIQFNCLVSVNVEADDYAVNCHQKYQGSSVLIGIDKDNLQSSGWHHNYSTGVSKFISLSEAQWSLAYQMLAGDPGDNITGLYRVGKATAEAYLKDSPAPMKTVYDVYEEKDLLGAYYTEQYRLLYMLRDEVIPFEGNFITVLKSDSTEVEAIEDEQGEQWEASAAKVVLC